MFEYFISYICL